ncbi:Protein DGCR6 [Lemmus lemmus]
MLTRRSACSSFQQRLSYTTLSDLALALLDGTVFEIVQGLLEIQHLTEKSLYNQRLRLQNEHRGARGGKGGAGDGTFPGRLWSQELRLGSQYFVGMKVMLASEYIEKFLQFSKSFIWSPNVGVAVLLKCFDRVLRQALRQKHLEAQQTCRPHNLPVLQAAQQRELEAMEHRIREEQQTMDRKIVLELDRKVTDQQSTLEKAGVAGFYVTTNPQELTLQMNLLELIRKLQQRGCQVGKAAL